jgi:hypothetical protein
MRTNPRIREEREHLESSSLVTYKSLGELTVLSTIGEEFQSALLNAFAQRLLSVRRRAITYGVVNCRTLENSEM